MSTVSGSDDGESVMELQLQVPEMDCPSCADKVEAALADVDGVSGVDPSPATGTVTLTASTGEVREAAVAAIERAGYDVTDIARGSEGGMDIGESPPVWRTPRAIQTAASGVLLLAALVVRFLLSGANVGLGRPLGQQLVVSDALLLFAIAVGGEVILRNGYYSARNLSLDIDFLMSVAVLGATGVSLFTTKQLFIEAASLAVLFNVAELLERHAVDRARNSLGELLELSPETALVRRANETTAAETNDDPCTDGGGDCRENGHSNSNSTDTEIETTNGTQDAEDTELIEVPVEDVRVGETVVIEPGEKVPVDGTVIEGESAVNEAPITGESVPVDKTIGDNVYAGSINESGYIEVEVAANADETTISRVIDLVERAQERKTKREQFVDRFAGYYTPVVVAVAILTAALPPLVLNAPPIEWFVRGITLLVIACPCAFVISTPVTVVSGITSAARNGVLIKGGDHLERMGEVDAIALDKTGTLTTGELDVTDVVPLNGNTEDEVLRCAHGLEARSEHPIAEAIVGHADESSATNGDREITSFESLTGQGVRAELGGATHYAGKPDLFADLGFDLSHVHFTTETEDLPAEVQELCERDGCLDLVKDTIPRLQAEGKTVILVGTDEEIEGLIAVADTVRPESERAITALRERGLTTVMLTGDNEGTARAVAEQIGVDEFHAGLLPEEKVDAIEQLQAEYGQVAMVGDGINDAPALATADVGIAMGAAGSDTAIETADIALLGDELSRLPYLASLSRTGNSVIRQNIWGSLGVKALLALGIPLGFVGVIHAVLIGDVGMTTAITGNAMRLARLEPGDLLS